MIYQCTDPLSATMHCTHTHITCIYHWNFRGTNILCVKFSFHLIFVDQNTLQKFVHTKIRHHKLETWLWSTKRSCVCVDTTHTQRGCMENSSWSNASLLERVAKQLRQIFHGCRKEWYSHRPCHTFVRCCWRKYCRGSTELYCYSHFLTPTVLCQHVVKHVLVIYGTL